MRSQKDYHAIENWQNSHSRPTAKDTNNMIRFTDHTLRKLNVLF